MIDNSIEQARKPQLSEAEFLKKIDQDSEKHFEAIKDRLENFYRRLVKEDSNLLPRGINSETIDNLFKEETPTTNLEDLRFAKALNPFSIKKSDHISDWVPSTTRAHLESQLLIQDVDKRNKRFFATCVTLGLIQLLRKEGIQGANHPDVRIRNFGGLRRQNYEKHLSKYGEREVYPTYAVVEKQDFDKGYANSVRHYGSVECLPDLGIMGVLVMKNELAQRSAFYFGDTIYHLTKLEREESFGRAEKTSGYKQLKDQGDILSETEIKRLTMQISQMIFPTGQYWYEWDREDDEMDLHAKDDTIEQGILGISGLLQAFELAKKLKTKGLFIDQTDYIEAHVISSLTQNDCEAILINNSIKGYIHEIMDEMSDDIKKRYNDLVNEGVIKFHNIR